MADPCADRNEAFTDGYSGFARGQLRQPPVKYIDRSTFDIWLSGWDQAAMLLQQNQQAHRRLIEQQSEIVALLLEGAALARGFADTHKISVRDKGRCEQLIRATDRLEKSSI